MLSATLQLEGSTILPLTHATQQQAVVAVAQSVGEGVVADNVTVVAQVRTPRLHHRSVQQELWADTACCNACRSCLSSGSCLSATLHISAPAVQPATSHMLSMAGIYPAAPVPNPQPSKTGLTCLLLAPATGLLT